MAVVLEARTKVRFLFPSTRLRKKVKVKMERKKKDPKKSLLIGGVNILLRKRINVNMATKMVIVMPRDTRTRKRALRTILGTKENQGSNNITLTNANIYIISYIGFSYLGTMW